MITIIYSLSHSNRTSGQGTLKPQYENCKHSSVDDINLRSQFGQRFFIIWKYFSKNLNLAEPYHHGTLVFTNQLILCGGVQTSTASTKSVWGISQLEIIINLYFFGREKHHLLLEEYPSFKGCFDIRFWLMIEKYSWFNQEIIQSHRKCWNHRFGCC